MSEFLSGSDFMNAIRSYHGDEIGAVIDCTVRLGTEKGEIRFKEISNKSTPKQRVLKLNQQQCKALVMEFMSLTDIPRGCTNIKLELYANHTPQITYTTVPRKRRTK